MKKTLSFSAAFFGLIFFLTSCSEMSFFQVPEPEAPPVVEVSPAPSTPSPSSQNIRVLIRQVSPASSDYYFWSSLLGSEKRKKLGWRDAASLSPRQLFFVKDGFSIDGKKYSGALVVEKDPKGVLRLLNEISVETYLRGVVPSEMPTSWPSEALKAQAVVARTYALYDAGDQNKFLENTVMDQVYQADKISPAADRAIQATEGEALTFNRKPFPAYFHSSSGGITTTIPSVWPQKQDFPALQSIQDPHSLNSPVQNWRTELSPWEIGEAIRKRGYNVGQVRALQVLKRDATGRVVAIKAEGHLTSKVFEGNNFRLMLGWKNLKSTLFDLTVNGDRFVFIGHGFGHGVGLSQYGAKAMAEKGYDYKQILKFYFPKADLK